MLSIGIKQKLDVKKLLILFDNDPQLNEFISYSILFGIWFNIIKYSKN